MKPSVIPVGRVRRVVLFRLLAAVALLILITGSSFGLRPVQAQGAPTYTISVEGVGTASAEPDIAFVELGVEILNTNLSTAYSKASVTIKDITDVLTGLKIELSDIQTVRVSISPEDRLDARTGPTGNYIYRVRRLLRVTVRDLTQLDSAISAAVEAGANTISGFSFGFNDTGAVEQAARAQAIKDARQRAETLATALNFSVGDAILVTETVTTALPSPPGNIDLRGAATPIKSVTANLGQLIVTVHIQITFVMRVQH